MKTLRWNGDHRDPIRLEYHGGPLTWSYPEHRHEGFWELLYILHGKLIHRINGSVVELTAGGLACVRDGDRHGLEGHGVRFVNLGFVSAIADTLSRLPAPGGDPLRWLRTQQEPLSCQIASGERVRWEAAFDRLGAALGGSDEMPALLGIIAEALPALRRGAEPVRTAPLLKPPAWLVPLQALLHDHELELPDLDGLRRRAGVSAEHLARSFQRHLGMSPSRFINRCRTLRLAKALAAHPDQPISALAAGVGFASLTHAARCFRAVFGTTPSDWRRRPGEFQLTLARQAALYHEREPHG